MKNDDELRDHIAELLNALHGYLSMFDVLRQRAAHLSTSTTIDPAEMRRHAREVRPIAEPVMANWYGPLLEHADAILTQATDKNLRVLVRKLKRLAGAEVEDLLKLIGRTEETSGLGDGFKVIFGDGMVTALGMFTRRQQIRSAMTDIQNFRNKAA